VDGDSGELCPLCTEEGAASGVILVIDHASASGPLL